MAKKDGGSTTTTKPIPSIARRILGRANEFIG